MPTLGQVSKNWGIPSFPNVDPYPRSSPKCQGTIQSQWPHLWNIAPQNPLPRHSWRVGHGHGSKRPFQIHCLVDLENEMSRRKQKFISLRPCFQESECIRRVPPHFLMHVDICWLRVICRGDPRTIAQVVTQPQHQAAHNALQAKRSDWSSRTALDAEVKGGRVPRGLFWIPRCKKCIRSSLQLETTLLLGLWAPRAWHLDTLPRFWPPCSYFDGCETVWWDWWLMWCFRSFWRWFIFLDFTRNLVEANAPNCVFLTNNLQVSYTSQRNLAFLSLKGHCANISSRTDLFQAGRQVHLHLFGYRITVTEVQTQAFQTQVRP